MKRTSVLAVLQCFIRNRRRRDWIPSHHFFKNGFQVGQIFSTEAEAVVNAGHRRRHLHLGGEDVLSYRRQSLGADYPVKLSLRLLLYFWVQYHVKDENPYCRGSRVDCTTI